MDPEAKKTFIHIGYPKCASTYLQQEIFPAMGNFIDLTKQPHAIKWMLLGDGDPAQFRKHMEEVMPNDRPDKNHQIISYEGFAPNLFHTITDLFWNTRRMDVTAYRNPQRSVVEKLAEAYPDASIIIVIREQIAWAVSQYKMYWRRGHTKEHVDTYIDHYLDGYDQVIEQYQKTFGRDKVLVIPFELLREERENFVRTITDFIDPSHEPNVSGKRINHAPDLLRDSSYQHNRRALKLKWKDSTRHSGFLMKIATKLLWCCANALSLPYYALKHGSQKDQVQVSPDAIEKVVTQIIESNRRLEALTGLDLRRFGYRFDRGFTSKPASPPSNDA